MPSLSSSTSHYADMQSIKDQIRDGFVSSGITQSQGTATKVFARFEVDWEPLTFVRNNYPGQDPIQSIRYAITLTGDFINAQALCACEYLDRTWPNSGDRVMGLILAALRDPEHRVDSGSIYDGAELQIRLDGTCTKVDAFGTIESITETAEQFAWLGATLRSTTTRAALCSPTIRNLSFGTVTPRNSSSDSGPYIEMVCSIHFKQDPPRNAHEETAWHRMFRNPIIVLGFPIRARHENVQGLELSLKSMQKLVDCKLVTEFAKSFYLKGFSSMLIASHLIGDHLLWCHYFNENGKHISYNDHDLQGAEGLGLKMQQLTTLRHVVLQASSSNQTYRNQAPA